MAERRAGAKLRELGATFPLPGDDAAVEDRILPADWMPRIVPRDHWTQISAGPLQRGVRSTPGSPTSRTAKGTWCRNR